MRIMKFLVGKEHPPPNDPFNAIAVSLAIAPINLCVFRHILIFSI
jgi:hypothetical protein